MWRTDGAGPLYGSLIMDATGNLYATTTSGGGASGFGAVFRVDATGHETKLNLTGHKQIGVALTSAISRSCPSLHSSANSLSTRSRVWACNSASSRAQE